MIKLTFNTDMSQAPKGNTVQTVRKVKTAARASQKADLRTNFEQCQQCGSRLTIAEAIERHCIECHSKPKRIVHKHTNINTGEASDAA